MAVAIDIRMQKLQIVGTPDLTSLVNSHVTATSALKEKPSVKTATTEKAWIAS